VVVRYKQVRTGMGRRRGWLGFEREKGRKDLVEMAGSRSS
jgi:hypothetical protein